MGRDVAGGETSEFTGDIDGCPEIVSETPLDLELGPTAAAAALAAGQRELGMVWKKDFATDAISGFEEHTQLSLDITVLRGRELVYGTGGEDHPEIVAACDGTTARELELDISLQTFDGALQASFRHWVGINADGSQLFSALASKENRAYGAENFTSGIDLGLDPALGGTERLYVDLMFDTESVRGSLMPLLSLPPQGGRDYDATWAPVSGSFPDTPCGPYHRVVDLDEERSELGTTPRAAFEDSLLRRGTPMAAAWEDPYPTLTPEQALLGTTEVTVTAGSPTHACQDTDRIEVHAPLTLQTADGGLDVTQPGSISLRSNGGDYVRSHSSWIPADEFEGATGMSLGTGAEYGAVELSYWQDADGSIEGNLRVHVWHDFEEEPFARPGLHW